MLLHISILKSLRKSYAFDYLTLAGIPSEDRLENFMT